MTQPITGKTQLLGIIGDPVEHSLSPVMHNAAIAKLGLDYLYVPFPVKSDDLETALSGLAAIGVKGFSITIPHKQGIIPLLSEVSAEAQLIGAVNTVWRTKNGWSGTNTDIDGFLAPLKTIDQPWQQITPVILGNGGAARAVVVGCYQLGCSEICVVGRNTDKLAHFYQSWANTPIQKALKVHRWDHLPRLVSQTKLLINTTPLGMYPQVNNSPLDMTIMEQLNSQAIVYDLIYTPNPTLWLKQAQQQGATIIDGLEMLVQQGAVALEIWLQQPVPVDIMRQSLREYLGFTEYKYEFHREKLE
jgi:shikimate dehydrogenase